MNIPNKKLKLLNKKFAKYLTHILKANQDRATFDLNKIATSSRRMEESYEILILRENELFLIEEGDMLLKENQKIFVAKFEAFFQQIYTYLSASLNFFNLISPQTFREFLEMKKCKYSIDFF